MITRYFIFIAFHLFWINNLIAQKDTTKHCVNFHDYSVMDIKETPYPDIPYNSDSIQIIIENERPPLEWWRTTANYNTKDWKFFITDGKIYSKQKLVRIVNRGYNDKIIVCPDHALMLALQAKNEKGEWVYVEKIIETDFALSFNHRYNDTLKHNYEILTFTECPSGEIKTRYRFILLEIEWLPWGKKREDRIRYYSNEVEGTISRCKLIF
jgi:hypothetical protein